MELQSDWIEKLNLAVEQSDAVAALDLIAEHEFTVLELADDEELEEGESEEDAHVALTAELDDFSVIVAFSSNEMAGMFAEAMPEFFDEREEIPAFMVNGAGLLANLPEGYGLLLNPETDDSCVIPAELASLMQRLLVEVEDDEDLDAETGD